LKFDNILNDAEFVGANRANWPKKQHWNKLHKQLNNQEGWLVREETHFTSRSWPTKKLAATYSFDAADF